MTHGLFPPDLMRQAEAVLTAARAKGWRIATAESCTGGLVAALLTEIAGSSDVVECGFITYANAAKAQMLGVDPALIAHHGAVSDPVARAMAAGALAASQAHLTVAITGVAGPGGGTAGKPVGLVHFATATALGIESRAEHFGDLGRSAVRLAAVRVALEMLGASLDAHAGLKD